MHVEFTPAAERALAVAAGWTSSAVYADREALHLPEILLGLLAEPECRAALLATSCGIDAAAVQSRFELEPLAESERGRAEPFRPNGSSACWPPRNY